MDAKSGHRNQPVTRSVQPDPDGCTAAVLMTAKAVPDPAPLRTGGVAEGLDPLIEGGGRRP